MERHELAVGAARHVQHGQSRGDQDQAARGARADRARPRVPAPYHEAPPRNPPAGHALGRQRLALQCLGRVRTVSLTLGIRHSRLELERLLEA